MQSTTSSLNSEMTTRSTVNPIDVLFVGAEPSDNVMALSSDYQVHNIRDVDRILSTLNDSVYDLVILDSHMLNDELPEVAQKIKLNNPSIQVMAWSDADNKNSPEYIQAKGIDDFLDKDVSGDALAQRLQSTLMNKHRKPLPASEATYLRKISQIAKRLHSFNDLQTLIMETIKQTIESFALLGVAVYLHDDSSHLHLGVGSSVRERTITTDALNTFRKVVASENVQIYDVLLPDIAALLPTSEHTSDVVGMLAIPFSTEARERGLLLIFDNDIRTLSLPVFDMLAGQFAIALGNLKLRAMPPSTILGAMQGFVGLSTVEDVIAALYTLVQNIPTVKNTLVWVETETTPIVRTGSSEENVRGVLHELQSRNLVSKHLLTDLKKSRSSITLQIERGKQNPLGPLFRLMVTAPLVAFPIQVGTNIIGTIVVSATSPEGISKEDRSFIEVLTYTTEEALSHILQPAPAEDKKEDLEVILEHLSEAVFIVEDNATVKFCNPRFAELTGISPDSVLNQHYTDLLQHLSELTVSPGQTKVQAQQTIDTLFERTSNTDRMVIVLPTSNRQFDFELIALNTQGKRNWAGILREKPQVFMPAEPQNRVGHQLELILEQSRLPFAQLHSSITSLIEEHRYMNHRELNTFLRHIEDKAANTKRLWNIFRAAYDLETDVMQPALEAANPKSLIDQVMEARCFSRDNHRFQFKLAGKIPTLMMDLPKAEQAVSNLLQAVIDLSPADTPVAIELKSVDDEVHLIVDTQVLTELPDQTDQIFEPLFWLKESTEQITTGLSLYLSKELIQDQGGHIWAESVSGQRMRITITLPEQATEVKSITPVRQPDSSNIQPQMPKAKSETSRAPERTLQTIMVIQRSSGGLSRWISKLRSENYELLIYDSTEVALRELSLTRFDLILLDARLGHDEAKSLDVCGWIRKQSAVPIIIVNDAPSEDHKVQALKLGADDYIIQSISDDEFMARVNVIFKRQHIPARTREPLEVNDIRIDFARREVTLKGLPIKLTRIQYDLLYTLAVNREQVLTHEQLLEKVWGPEYRGETQYLWVNISRLRKKLEPDETSPCFIQNVPGIGYTFKS